METTPELLSALRSIKPTGTPFSSLDDEVSTALLNERLVKLVGDGKGGSLVVSGLGAKALQAAETVRLDDPTPAASGDPEAATVPLSVPEVPEEPASASSAAEDKAKRPPTATRKPAPKRKAAPRKD